MTSKQKIDDAYEELERKYGIVNMYMPGVKPLPTGTVPDFTGFMRNIDREPLLALKNAHSGLLKLNWTITLPKESCRDPADKPTTVTKISAILQNRRVAKRNGWYVTLQTSEEWRLHYASEVEWLRERIRYYSGDRYKNYNEGILSLRQIIANNKTASPPLAIVALAEAVLPAFSISQWQMEADETRLKMLIEGGCQA